MTECTIPQDVLDDLSAANLNLAQVPSENGHSNPQATYYKGFEIHGKTASMDANGDVTAVQWHPILDNDTESYPLPNILCSTGHQR